MSLSNLQPTIKKLYLKDIRNFVSKLSLRRITNAFQILLSYHVAKYAGKAVQWGLPFTVSFRTNHLVQPASAPNAPADCAPLHAQQVCYQTIFLGKPLPKLPTALSICTSIFRANPTQTRVFRHGKIRLR